MNDCEETGIVGLEDLPDKEVYVNLKKDFQEGLKNRIKSYGVLRFCRKLNVNSDIIYHWLNTDSLVNLNTLKKIFKFFNIQNIENKVDFLRGKKGCKLYNPKLPFDFNTKEGVRIIASILGDGALHKNRPVASYFNSDLNLIEGFIKDVKFVFGNLELTSGKRNNGMFVELPSLCYHVFVKLGLKPGRKVFNNPSIPEFIFCLSDNKIRAFFSQIVDDEGSVNTKSRFLKINFNLKKTYNYCDLVVGLTKILNKLKVECSVYKQDTVYKNILRWQLQIHGWWKLRKLYPFLELRSLSKRDKLKLLIDSTKKFQYPKKECKNIFLSKMKKLENENGFFTVTDLASFLNRSIGHTRNMVCKYRKQGLIKCVETYITSKNNPSYAKYVITN